MNSAIPKNFIRQGWKPIGLKWGGLIVFGSEEEQIKYQLAQMMKEEVLKKHPEISALLKSESHIVAEIEQSRRQAYMDALHKSRDPDLGFASLDIEESVVWNRHAETPFIKAKQAELAGIKQKIDPAFSKFEEEYFATDHGKRFIAFIKDLEKAQSEHGHVLFFPGEYELLDKLAKGGAHAEFLRECPLAEALKRSSAASDAAADAINSIRSKLGVISKAELKKSNPKLGRLLEKAEALESSIKEKLDAVYKEAFNAAHKGPDTLRVAREIADEARLTASISPEILKQQRAFEKMTDSPAVQKVLERFWEQFSATDKSKKLMAFADAVEKMGGNFDKAVIEEITRTHADCLTMYPELAEVFKTKSSAAADTAEQLIRRMFSSTEQVAEGMWAKFAKMHWGGKTAIIGGAAAAAAGVGYWALKEDKRKEEQSNTPAMKA